MAARSVARVFTLGWMLLLLALPALAQPRVMLGLYKGSEEPDPSATRLKTFIEPQLPSGWSLELWDIEKGLPPAGRLAKVGALASWYGSAQIADPVGYINWLKNQIAQGRKMVIFGNFGGHTADGSTWMTNEQLNEFFYPFGLDYKAAYTSETGKLKLETSDTLAGPPPSLTYYLLFRSANPSNRVHLAVSRSDMENSQSALVVTTPYGGMAQETYLDTLDKRAFLAEALSQKTAKAVAGKKLLALYKSSEGQTAQDNHIVKFAQKPLYDLGYQLDFHDINSGFPIEMGQYAGLVSWYQGPEMSGAAQYAEWLRKQVQAGRKVIIIGNYGAFAEDVPTKAGDARRFLLTEEYNQFFYPFGLEFRAAWTPDRSKIKVVKKNPEVVKWLPSEHVGHYFWIRSVNPANDIFLSVDRADIDEGEAAVVVATPYGGLALESYILKETPGSLDPRFHIDFKNFFSRCLSPAQVAKSEGPEVLQRPARKPIPQLETSSKPMPPGTTRLKRKILAFYQRDFKERPDSNTTHLNAETILNHLGLLVEYRAVEDPLPSEAEMAQYRGVIAWFTAGEMANARKFDAWLQKQIIGGRKVVLMGNYAAAYDSKDLSFVDPGPTFAQMGLSYRSLGRKPVINSKRFSSFTANRTGAAVKFADEAMMGFERALDMSDKDAYGWPLIQSSAPNNKVYATLGDSEGDSDLVVITPTGGIALGPTTVYIKPGKKFRLSEGQGATGKGVPEAEALGGAPWRLDPFLFFSQAYQTQDLPKLDVTTLNGARIYYSHIDGDSFGGISLTDRSSLNGAVMERRILRDLGLPVTVSFVTQDIEKKRDLNYWRELEVARKIMALPNIEPAVHTFSHPFEWREGDIVGFEDGVLKRNEIDLDKEIRHSSGFVDSYLTPQSKRCEIVLWSGRCNPPAEALELTRTLGLLNMNGGETVYDSESPFIAGILPVSRQVDQETQYHVNAAGDFYYTGSWTRDYDGMKNLVWYFENTEKPRRLRCMNVYYHFYLAEREPGLDGLKIAYDYVKEQAPASMFASDYVHLLQDFLGAEVGRKDDGSIYVRNRGELRTVRFDQPGVEVNVAASQGVLGSTSVNGSLYVHLDDSQEHTIAFGPSTGRVPEVGYFTHYINDWKASPEVIRFATSGQGPARLQLRNLTAGATYKIEIQGKGQTSTQQAQANAQGVLDWQGQFQGYQVQHNVEIRRI